MAQSFSEIAGGRRRQVDGLRMIAMLGVFYVHFWNEFPVIEHARVSLFFVVSGFLITVILLRARQHGGRFRTARNFYIRRALRLLPPLLLVLAFAAALDMEGIRSSLPWHIFQLTNLHAFLNRSWDPWITAHLWSLNMLEQFYACWPLVILLLPLRRAVQITAVMLVLPAVVYAAALEGSKWTGIVVGFDSIAAGALLALSMNRPEVWRVLSAPAAGLAACVFVLSPLLFSAGFGQTQVYRVLLILALAVIVAGAWEGYKGPAGYLLGGRLAGFVNRISYSAYIYHLPLWWFLVHYGDRSLYERGPRTFVIMSAASLLAASVSWYCMERPIAALKEKFPTRPPGPGGKESAAENDETGQPPARQSVG
ncbi:acyltransferase [Leisingera sp. SS27]|uniref:acyltransferase family protein n=1 Tax=Leisingera sp. SS27 TaxID=2979462 RepID=UPI00232D9ED9|nr:acyltransferase [Leisingera sp. SS27]MDC0659165.1 acyltransferase [Leisingera sp. SS27]